MFKDLENKVVVITGAGSGLGKAFSEEFGKLKAKVVMNYLSEKHLDDVNETIKLIEDAGGQAIKVQGDVSVEDDVNNLVQTAVKEFGTLDVMINNAGFEKPIPSHEMSVSEWQKVIDINLTGAFMGAKAAVNQFLKEDKKGVILNTSSVHDTIPWPNYVNYAASKGGLKLMMETMSMEYAQYGIRINNISPGAIVTEHTREKFSDPTTRAETLEMIPAKEIGEAHQVANVALFLASDFSDYIHGTTIYVDGGMTNYPAFMGGKG
ncbi:glucose 1-dehydrogenase [Staphylococcus kloosii]|jgi:glucose 1-dehydrogenase|uniref:3-oxoacyl-[acyl-carrier-protein] reductase FabG n=1 Tax=Staphylococcus kloosii TaxID=29384 RepID=A0A151A1F5_9STAP|nr:glucose 1-dehydrogenase [Staphylococcus kloosii]KYH13258.1 sugar dehydrogenase [Staphylococcus kloosii]MBF7021441.1 glucose 1-dehydrogenase [Staphylococcus kloosii]MBF7030718.1 glucose 1-dehydrogenase [Staphylococcus kloosii]MCD8879977.1 glucose 1-dehydrogenase [Staphylococcus kloosii]PTJ80391.1 3-oxoacyl-ACP reductase [Staphylococcus kloosii]